MKWLLLLAFVLWAHTPPQPPAPDYVRQNREALNGFIQRDAWQVEQVTTLQAQIATLEAVVVTLSTPGPTITPVPTATPMPQWGWPEPGK